MLTRPLRARPGRAASQLFVVTLTSMAVALGHLGYAASADATQTSQPSEAPPRYESAALEDHDDSRPYTAE